MAKPSKKQIVESAEAAVETETDDELSRRRNPMARAIVPMMQSPSPPCLMG